MTSAENSVSEPPNLKIFWEKEAPPPPPYEARARLRQYGNNVLPIQKT